MRNKMLWTAAVTAALVLVAHGMYGRVAAEKDKKEDKQMLVHHVYFTLKDRTPKEKQKLVDACKKHLTKHEGEVFFSAGTVCEDLKREVNDLDFDVCLTVVFDSKASHDKYQDHKRHLAFIKENKDAWKKVRVFDSYATK